jgi:hypothetical protein
MWRGLLPQVSIAAIIVMYVMGKHASWRAAAGLLCALTAVVPLGHYFYVAPDLEASRYLYLPLVGWCLFLADCLAGQPSAWTYRVSAVVLAALIAAGGYGARLHQRPWLQAAALRDAILSQASVAIAESQCDVASFTGVPDKVSGAFVFRNGFREALARHLQFTAASDDSTVVPACRFRWSDNRFVVAAQGTS